MTEKKGKTLFPEKTAIYAVIIMFLITIVLALYLWNWIPSHDHEQVIEYDIHLKQLNRTKNNDFVVLINWSEPEKKCPIEDARFFLLGREWADYTQGQHRITEAIGKTIDNETFMVFQDNDNDEHLSTGDIFIIKSTNHIDDDGYTSPGFARPFFTIQVRANKHKMAEIELK